MESKSTTLGVRAVALAALFALPAAAQFTPSESDPAALFAPVDNAVPLSEFVQADGTNPVTLSVKPEILTWIYSRPGASARVVTPQGTTVTSSMNMNTGVFTCTPSQPTSVVVVSNSLFNHFYADQNAIVTHWDDARNDDPNDGLPPRGGYVRDARDGISRIDYGGVGFESDSFQLYEDERYDPALGSPDGKYLFATDDYALFSDGTETTAAKDGEIADLDVPGYERYMAENWSFYAITRLAAIHLSDEARERTGLPIAHRNPTPAFSTTVPASQRLQKGLPILQVVHAYVIDYDDVAQAGSENSLVTFLVPPGWDPNPQDPEYATGYPVVLSAFYDIHGFTFSPVGIYFLELIGTLALEDKLAIALLSNGGGSRCSITMQASIQGAIDELFNEAGEAGEKLFLDKNRVVTTGGSRGSMPALALSASPDHPDSIHVKYAFAGGPEPYVGDALQNYTNPTYAQLESAVLDGTGYSNAWKQGWTGPGGATAAQIAAQTFLGSSDFSEIAQTKDLGSEPFVEALEDKGTRVIIRTGSHDQAKPLGHVTDYYAALVAAGVPTRLEIGYRFGHGAAAYTEPGVPVQPDLITAMRRVFDDEAAPSGEEGIFHFRPESSDDEKYFIGRPFEPCHPPITLEAPLIAALGQTTSFSVTGPPEMEYAIYARAIDHVEWANYFNLEYLTGSSWVPIVAYAVLPQSSNEIVWASHPMTTSAGASVLQGPWTYQLAYRLAGEQDWTWVAGETSTPPSSAIHAPVLMEWTWDAFHSTPAFFLGNWYEFAAGRDGDDNWGSLFPSCTPSFAVPAFSPGLGVPTGSRIGGLSTDLSTPTEPCN